MNRDRIVDLLHPFLSAPIAGSGDSASLSSAQLDSISTYIDILIRWNARINLTAIHDPEDIVTRHFGESLFAARYLFRDRIHVGLAAQACPEPSRRGCPAERSSAALTLADLGSGAGFPGLPIKLWAPRISLTLVESNHKKATFLREVTRALTLTNVNIQNVRAETLAGKRLPDRHPARRRALRIRPARCRFSGSVHWQLRPPDRSVPSQPKPPAFYPTSLARTRRNPKLQPRESYSAPAILEPQDTTSGMDVALFIIKIA